MRTDSKSAKSTLRPRRYIDVIATRLCADDKQKLAVILEARSLTAAQFARQALSEAIAAEIQRIDACYPEISDQMYSKAAV